MTEMRVCAGCRSEKPVSEFYLAAGKPEPKCKVCRKNAMLEVKNRHADRNQIVDLTGSKKCTQCLVEKPKSEFQLRRCAPDGLTPWCQVCNKEYQKSYYHSANGQVGNRLSGAKQRAFKKEQTFGLDKDFIFDLWEKQSGLCALTGLPIDTEAAGTPDHHGPFSLSIDRIDSAKGYERDNVRLTVLVANLAKSVWSDETLLEFSLKWLSAQGYSVTKGNV